MIEILFQTEFQSIQKQSQLESKLFWLSNCLRLTTEVVSNSDLKVISVLFILLLLFTINL
jgi:hypothetical protein